MKKYFIFSLVSILLSSPPSFSQEQDRLAPTDQVEKLSLTYRQDGRALYVQIKNSGSYVITSLGFGCSLEHIDPKTLASTDDIFSKKIQRKILPGTTEEFYFEISRKIVNCYQQFTEVRGRQKKAVEFW